MANSQKTKGDHAEREIAELLTKRVPSLVVRRQLGAGRTNAAGGDVGDLDGIPHHIAQVAHWDNIPGAVRHKPVDAELQRVNAGERFAATFIRLRKFKGQPEGDHWRVVLTLDQWLAYLEAARFYMDSVS